MTIRSMSASMSNADISHTLLDDFAPDRWTPHQKKMHDEFRQWVKTLSAHTAAARADVARDTDLNPDGKQRKDAAIVAKATAEIAAIAAVADVHAKTAADLRALIEAGRLEPVAGGAFRLLFDPDKEPGGAMGVLLLQSEVRSALRGKDQTEIDDAYTDAVSAGNHLVAQALEDNPIGPKPSAQWREKAKQTRLEKSPHKDALAAAESLASVCRGYVEDLRREIDADALPAGFSGRATALGGRG